MENYDFEKEKGRLEKLSERAHRLVFRLHTMSVDKIDVDSPKPNVEALRAAQAALIELELLLPLLKEQLEYMLKHERKRAANDVAAFIDSLGDDKTMARVVDELSDKVVSVVEGLK